MLLLHAHDQTPYDQGYHLRELLEKNLLLKTKWYQIKNYTKNYRNKLLENLRNKKYTHLLRTIFGLLI